jgi:hypothetical protein
VDNTVGFGDLADGAHPAWVGDFDGSSKDDILFNYYRDGNWWLGTFAGIWPCSAPDPHRPEGRGRNPAGA